MIDKDKLNKIIELKRKGLSNREVARIVGCDKDTVAKYYNGYLNSFHKFNLNPNDPEAAHLYQSYLTGDPATLRKVPKMREKTRKIQREINQIFEQEDLKRKRLKSKYPKQAIDATGIAKKLERKGIKLHESTVRYHLRQMRKGRPHESYGRREFDPGERFEFDFGNVVLWIDGEEVEKGLAVFGLPTSGYVYACLVDPGESAESATQAHIKFFRHINGVPRTGVYDNFSGWTHFQEVEENGKKKRINVTSDRAREVSNFYVYDIEFCPPRNPQAKGFVERFVNVIRKRAFSVDYEFDSLEEAEACLAAALEELNKDKSLDEERKNFRPYAGDFQVSEVTTAKIDKYSTFVYDKHHYSVPDDIPKTATLTVKIEGDHLFVYHKNRLRATHKKVEYVKGQNHWSLNYKHFETTLKTKPNFLTKNTLVKRNPVMNELFYQYFNENSVRMANFLLDNLEADESELIDLAPVWIELHPENKLEETLNQEQDEHSKQMDEDVMSPYKELFKGGERK